MTKLEFRRDKYSSHDAYHAGVTLGHKDVSYRVYDWKGQWTVTGLLPPYDRAMVALTLEDAFLACKGDLAVRERRQRWKDYMDAHDPPDFPGF